MFNILFNPYCTIFCNSYFSLDNCDICPVQIGRIVNLIRIEGGASYSWYIGGDSFVFGIEGTDKLIYISSFF